jgi:acetyl esterase/lipase
LPRAGAPFRMRFMKAILLGALLGCFLLLPHLLTATEVTLTEDVVYGRKFGLALTMDVLEPARPNGHGIILVVSGGWFSAKEAIPPSRPWLSPFLERGYTVFAVLHGSQPKFAVPEIIQDIHRAVRFIRHNQELYGIDADRLGITGGSAGGHLSLMVATQGGPGDAGAADPVDRESSAVQAVACFFPPTDFLNYGGPGEDGVGAGVLAPFRAAFGPRVDDPEQRLDLGREISPIYFVSSDLPPTLIAHGDADLLVPIQQAVSFVQRAHEAGARAELIVRHGEGHGWATFAADLRKFADWFDEHLRGITIDRSAE